ncbi:uncharacterized protein AB9W97_016869 isoform 1-T7 [Spinachia spinachia]
MSSRGEQDSCQICSGALQGNQRRWLFGAQNKKAGGAQTQTGSLRKGSLSRSPQSSPWGSTCSLGSSVSLSQLSLSSQAKAVDPLSVLTHILGRPVPRGGGRGEFVCGKCVKVLERVFKFDSVIARVRVLSFERLQKLTQERDKVRRWVRQNYYQRHPGDVRSRGGSTSEEEEEEGKDGAAEKEGYREMLKENMALSEYECWSDKWDACPYSTRTGKLCRNGKGCEGCDSLRVSDSDYESVCGLPRRLSLQPFSSLSRDRSQSMSGHWHGVTFLGSDPTSLAGSTLSLRTSSRTESVHSLDSLDSNDPFGVRPDNFWLTELRALEGTPVRSPLGSRIPVLDRKYSGAAAGTGSPSVNRALRFGVVWENGAGDVDVEEAQPRDDFMPLHRVGSSGRVHHAVRHLRGQLGRAVAPSRSLHGQRSEINGSDDGIHSLQEAEEKEDSSSSGALLQSLGRSLHSRERVIQECVGLIRRLSVEDGAGAELANKLTQYLKETQSNDKAALQTLTSEATAKESSMEREIEALRKAGRDREGDLDTLNAVLQCNREILNDLQVSLQEKERLLKEVENEREVWRQRDHALTAVLQEKEALIQELASSQKGVQRFTGDTKDDGATLCMEVIKLTTALQEYQDMVQIQQASHSQTVSLLREELGETRRELRAKEKEKKEAERTVRNVREDREREERKLRDSLENRDRLIEQILLHTENRDGLLVELQQNLQNHREPLTVVQRAL